jgi:broad specificity phosphatase PhoE
MSETTIVHLLRHGKVDNPQDVLYGRLPDFHLSGEGRAMAVAAAEYFADRPVVALFASPLDRAQETAAPIAERLGLPIVTEGGLIESENRFEGQRHPLRKPANWPWLYNPFRPSWGEPYRDVVARMDAALSAAREAAIGREAVCVSHQLPIWVTRLAAEERNLWHNPAMRECALGSVTSFAFDEERLTGVSYTVPPRSQVPHPDAAQ